MKTTSWGFVPKVVFLVLGLETNLCLRFVFWFSLVVLDFEGLELCVLDFCSGSDCL